MNNILSLHVLHFSRRLSIRVQMASIFLLLISACSLFKDKSFYRSDSLYSHIDKLELKQVLDLKSHRIRISNRKDSSSAEFYIEIFPRGSFSYSPINGFSGQAEMLRLSGKISSMQKTLDSSVTDSTLKLNSDLGKKSKSELRTVKKEKEIKKKIPDWIWVTGILILISLGIVYRRIYGYCNKSEDSNA